MYSLEVPTTLVVCSALMLILLVGIVVGLERLTKH